MALEESNGSGMVMPVTPMYGGGNNGGFGNGFGGDGWWILLLFLLLGNGNWGGNGFGGGFGGGNDLYPWMNQSNQMNDGFQNQLMNDNITSIRDGVHNLSTQLCNCCSDMQMSLANGFSGVEQGANARQMANMQQAFANQMAMSQGFNNIQSQFADCCCENRLGIANLANVVQTENCADRAALSDGIRDLLTNQTANTQRILDQLCSDKIDAKNEKIADLERQLTMANLAASQTAQTAQVVDNIYNRLSTCPVGTVPVYGEQPIFRCNNNGCGCGCNGGF